MDIRRRSGKYKKPQGEATRGKTAPGRLRRVDHWLCAYAPGLITRRDGLWRGGLFVDLGFGSNPGTTLESAACLRRLNPELRVLGVEIDSERVRAALPFADELTSFRLGGFNLPLKLEADGGGEKVRVIRAFNVLRQYTEEKVAEAHGWLCSCLLPGGLLIEGTSNPSGSLWVANLLRHCTGQAAGVGSGYRAEALVFSVNLKNGFDPVLLQAVLPKNYIHHMVPGQEIYEFFAAWKAAGLQTVSRGISSPREKFLLAGRALAQVGYKVALQKRWLSRGYLIWYLG